MYYSVKLNWLQPKEGSDEMEKKSKPFLVYAESCTEAEAKMINWVPSNYQDADVTDVKKTNIGELKLEGNSETFWLVKVLDDMDGTSDKPKPYFLVYDGEHLEAAVAKASKDWSGSEIEEVKKYKTIVDNDLVDENSTGAMTKQKKVVIAPMYNNDDDLDTTDDDDQDQDEA